MAGNTFFVMQGQSIQAAIVAASAGDVIWVGPGIFNESLVIDKSLTLLSLDGADSTTINGGPDPYGFSGAIRVNTGVDFVTIGGTTDSRSTRAQMKTPRFFSAATIPMSLSTAIQSTAVTRIP
jgi:nitrous oxidase accessory protein NosD